MASKDTRGCPKLVILRMPPSLAIPGNRGTPDNPGSPASPVTQARRDTLECPACKQWAAAVAIDAVGGIEPRHHYRSRRHARSQL